MLYAECSFIHNIVHHPGWLGRASEPQAGQNRDQVRTGGTDQQLCQSSAPASPWRHAQRITSRQRRSHPRLLYRVMAGSHPSRLDLCGLTRYNPRHAVAATASSEGLGCALTAAQSRRRHHRGQGSHRRQSERIWLVRILSASGTNKQGRGATSYGQRCSRTGGIF
jgi:hypothetical protein